MTISVDIIADSVNPDGKRITTIQARYPRFIHAQVMTHRMFSRNAQSSRAMPVKRMIEEIESDPVYPMHWGKNQKGMQADEECNNSVMAPHFSREDAWKFTMMQALEAAKAFDRAGYHKQIVNRLLEPFAHITVIITATEWQNFFDLRCHPHAQPEIEELANRIKGSMGNSYPKDLWWGDFHLPYIEYDVRNVALDMADDPLYQHITVPTYRINGKRLEPECAIKSSVASCARVSYNNHDGTTRVVEKDMRLHDQLKEDGHMSPFEHQARAMRGQYSNFNGFCSYRWEIENGR